MVMLVGSLENPEGPEDSRAAESGDEEEIKLLDPYPSVRY
jgi:hypothetical protein